MVTSNTFSRLPTKLDYAAPTQFKFSIVNMPKVEYFVITATLPGITLDGISLPTPLKATQIVDQFKKLKR